MKINKKKRIIVLRYTPSFRSIKITRIVGHKILFIINTVSLNLKVNKQISSIDYDLSKQASWRW